MAQKRSPFAMADSSCLWSQSAPGNSIPSKRVTEVEKMKKEVESQSAARTDLQKQLWQVKRQLQKVEQEKQQLKQTIKAMQKVTELESRGTVTVHAEPSNSPYLELSLRINKFLFSTISSYYNIEGEWQQEYQQQFENIFQITNSKLAMKKLQELLYHISLHKKGNKEKNYITTDTPNSATITKLENKVAKYKQRLQEAQYKSSPNHTYCNQCQIMQHQITQIDNERSVLLGYVQTYKEQQKQLQMLLQKTTDELKEEQEKRLYVQEEGNLSSQLTFHSNRDQRMKMNRTLLEVQEQLDQSISEVRRWEEQARDFEIKFRSLETEKDEWMHQRQLMDTKITVLSNSMGERRETSSKLEIDLNECQSHCKVLEAEKGLWQNIVQDIRASLVLHKRKTDFEVSRLEELVAVLHSGMKQKLADFNQFATDVDYGDMTDSILISSPLGNASSLGSPSYTKEMSISSSFQAFPIPLDHAQPESSEEWYQEDDEQ